MENKIYTAAELDKMENLIQTYYDTDAECKSDPDHEDFEEREWTLDELCRMLGLALSTDATEIVTTAEEIVNEPYDP